MSDEFVSEYSVRRIIVTEATATILSFSVSFIRLKPMVKSSVHRVATNLENMENLENSGNSENCQNLRKTQGNLNFYRKLKENVEYGQNRRRKCIPANYSLLNYSGKSLKMT